jgi:hypothetical protein
MFPKAHEFDFLIHWASLNDTELEKIVCDNSIAVLQRAADLLRNEFRPVQIVVDRTNFVSTVRDLRRVYANGSNLLGDAILEASDWLDKGQPDKAKEVYQRFLSMCASKFYRDIAKSQLQNIP